ncbi:MAG: hypothetical protein IJ131_10930, partial [Eggerthellaceae bacterium]|nr:hypothetical protein [Eggerthellaceae bacterium]
MRVVRTKWFYSGNYQDNYFSGMQPIDVLWFVLLFAAVLLGTCVVLAIYRFLLERVSLRDKPVNTAVVFCISWLVIFVCWVPYLLANFPCILFADSIVIIRQALGHNALSSHHPIAYVGLIGLFLNIGDTFFDSYITGIALYATFQMALMSGVFAYLLSWMAAHRISMPAVIVFCAMFSLLSIFPIHATSMWKDGLYAVFVLRVSLLLFDAVASRGAELDRPAFLVRLALWGLAVCLVRSNGIYVMVCVWLALFALYATTRLPRRSSASVEPSASGQIAQVPLPLAGKDSAAGKADEGVSALASQPAIASSAAVSASEPFAYTASEPAALEAAPSASEPAASTPVTPASASSSSHSKNPVRLRWGLYLACAVSLGAWALVVGPLSVALNVQTEPVESYGIPLQQVAAVVVYDGDLTDEQSQFLDTLLPLEDYKEEYIPCSVDGIKWADHFDTEFFDSHRPEFMRIWAEVGLQNPGLYANAYIMESYEYWSFADIGRTFT